jgi:hypothetical protein
MLTKGWGGLALVFAVVGALAVAPAVHASAPDVHAPAQTVFTVSPTGSGTACTVAAPCALATAQTAVRAIDGDLSADADVELTGGTYAPFALTAADSGSNGHDVVYKAAPGAAPVVSGGMQITGWHLVPGTTATWEAAIPAGFDTRQLYLDGTSLPLSQGLPSGEYLQTSTGYTTTADVAGLTDPSNLALVFTGGNGAWTQTFCNVASISGSTITMAQPCWRNLHLGVGVQEASWLSGPWGGFGGLSPVAQPSFIENAYQLLTPGHWSIDRITHTLYYMAAAGQDIATATFVAPAQQTLLSITGAHDVSVQGLEFAYGGWTAPDTPDGFAQMQADWTLTGLGSEGEGTCTYSTPPGTCPFASWTRTPANVVLTATHDVTVEGDTFTHLGGAGLDIYDGSQDDLVQGNLFDDIAASGIQLGATDDPNGTVDGNTIVGNDLDNVANQYLGGVGIFVGYTHGTTIEHNQISHVPYTGISIGWGGWHTDLLKPDADPSVNGDNVIADNLLFDYMQTLGDGGAIYSNGPQAGGWSDALKITGNVAYGGTNTDFSLYTDAGSEYVDISGNVLYDQPLDSFDSGGCHTIGHIVLNGNYADQGGPAYPCFAYTDVTSTNSESICSFPPPSQIPAAILEAAGTGRSLTDAPPEVDEVGPADLDSSGGQVLISGSGFTSASRVSFGGRSGSAVQVLSPDFIVATAPAGQGTVDVTVTTGAGTSALDAADRITYQAIATPCIPGVGTGLSTALVTTGS